MSLYLCDLVFVVCCYCLLCSFTSLRTLRSDTMSQLVAVPGIVVSASRANTKARTIALQCRNCKTTKRISCNDGFGGARVPRKCDHAPLNAEEPRCPLDPFIMLTDDSTFVDTQSLKLQESPENVPTGEMPRNIQLHVSHYLVNRVKPGSRVVCVGILSILEAKAGDKNTSGPAASAVRQPYLRVIGLQVRSQMALMQG
jgi:DNA replication licensing factor MCM5